MHSHKDLGLLGAAVPPPKKKLRFALLPKQILTNIILEATILIQRWNQPLIIIIISIIIIIIISIILLLLYWHVRFHPRRCWLV